MKLIYLYSYWVNPMTLYNICCICNKICFTSSYVLECIFLSFKDNYPLGPYFPMVSFFFQILMSNYTEYKLSESNKKKTRGPRGSFFPQSSLKLSMCTAANLQNECREGCCGKHYYPFAHQNLIP